ncbi:sortase-like acyltransferase [Desulfitobacterium dehalogenans ATCC 51507]|uniref:Sortase-like acyltransferase n=1 Tax=Desulfitobacterium dehalogenans (strain ATCC 51507 / DSM 9161 / JW/IU-DC1) TaxID=756499 RepID=I4AA37_DESDJ|nr:GNAT family N-acetyltransferase [Desulfitobacterium dehalogenans]AFM00822.1 sortase-like acyltransferase [Desulfitobacterium dehalogenans ATCC 51507]
MEVRFVLRKAQYKDIEQINEIYNWAVLNTVATFDMEERSFVAAEAWFDMHQDPYYPVYVVESQGQVIGWGSLSPFHPRPAYKQSGEFSIYIASGWTGQSLGDTLLKVLCQEAKELGYHTLLGLITSTNEKSISLAKKHGFFEAGRYREVGTKFGQCLDVMVLQKIFN